MSVERIFRSRTSGNVYRYGPSIQPGEIGYIVDFSDDEEKLIVACCDHEDEGGVARDAGLDEYKRLNDTEVFIPQDLIDSVAQADRTTGIIFEGEVKLVDGDEGTLVICHSNSDNAQHN